MIQGEFPSAGITKSLSTKRNKKEGRTPDLQFYKTWLCEENQHPNHDKTLNKPRATAQVLTGMTAKSSLLEHEKLRPYQKFKKISHFSRLPTSLIFRLTIILLSKDFTNKRMMNNRATVY